MEGVTGQKAGGGPEERGDERCVGDVYERSEPGPRVLTRGGENSRLTMNRKRVERDEAREQRATQSPDPRNQNLELDQDQGQKRPEESRKTRHDQHPNAKGPLRFRERRASAEHTDNTTETSERDRDFRQ